MKIRKKKNVVIEILCSLLVFMGIGYAILSQVLTINAGGKIKGNWNIYIESIEPYNIAGHAKSIESKIGMDKLSASIEAELNQPNDYVDYKVVVKNGGSIKAQLTNAALLPKKTNKYIEITSTAVSGTILDTGDTMDFIVTIKFKDVDSFDTQDDAMSAITELQLSFMQVGTEGISNNIIENSTLAWPKFTINSEGLITSYNYDYGTEVVIPNEINGIPVKSIDKNSFIKANLYMGNAYNESTNDRKAFLIVVNPQNKEIIKRIVYEQLCILLSISDSQETCGGKTSLSEMGIPVYNSMEEAEISLEGYKLKLSPEYFNEVTNKIEKSTYKITKLDLSEANSLESIESSAFKGKIGDALNGECGNKKEGTCILGTLRSLILPINGKLKTINEYVFANNQLTSITIPVSVISILNSAFENNKLANVIFENTIIHPSQLTTIRYDVFKNNQLTSITIPQSVITIDGGVFFNNQLTSLIIPANVENIGGWAFSNNSFTSSKDITIEYNEKNTIGRFNEVWSNAGFPEKGPFDPKVCFSVNASEIIGLKGICSWPTNLVIPSVINGKTITGIQANVFKEKGLTSVTIPASITSIGTAAFADNWILSKDDVIIEYNKDNPITRFNDNWKAIGFPGNGPE